MGDKETLDEAFLERNMLALMLANRYYIDPENGWKVLVIDIPEGQLTFHVPPDFDTHHLRKTEPCWDGHTTTEKWERVKKHMEPNYGTWEHERIYGCPFKEERTPCLHLCVMCPLKEPCICGKLRWDHRGVAWKGRCTESGSLCKQFQPANGGTVKEVYR